MEYRILGRTGLHVSALALGTVELGLDYGIVAPGAFGRPSEAEAQRLVHAAVDAGINLIDTARDYGESEAVLGRALRGRREQVILATKVRAGAQSLPDSTALRREMLASLETSLQQLQTDYVDLWQIHNLDAEMLARVDVLAEVFAEARQSGKVRWAGGSTYGSALPMAALQTGAFDVLQGTYSVLDQRLADRVLPMAAARNVGIVIRSILLKGALTPRGDYLPDHLDRLRARSRRFRRLVDDAGLELSPIQAAIAFGLAHPQIGSVLVGVRSEAELHEDLRAAELRLPDELCEQLRGLRLDDAELLNPATWGIP